jgi:hypothetical protein
MDQFEIPTIGENIHYFGTSGIIILADHEINSYYIYILFTTTAEYKVPPPLSLSLSLSLSVYVCVCVLQLFDMQH